ncbi:uncharacterized protein LOC143735520 [Siphateles boraxobius]|uniref:uncharacterized protein LOC143735520 n=1 Tax=Siphateles boraxobius TaxID=180520 RepID=UPI0040645D91
MSFVYRCCQVWFSFKTHLTLTLSDFVGMYNNMKSILQVLFLMCGKLFGVDADEVKEVSVMEGYYVTLNPDVTEIQGFILIQWRFGASGSVIAETVGNEISYPHLTEIFRDRLLLDHQTGSLTIKNMRNKHSGLYQLEINHSAGTTHMTFSVTVSDSPVIDVEMKSVTAGDSVTLQTDVTEPHGDELIVWRFEGKLIAKCDIETKSSKLYEDADERFRGRLKLDNQTGSLNISDTRTTDSGLYTAMISSSKQTLYRRFNVTINFNISEAAPEGDSHVKEEKIKEPCLPLGAVAGIVIGVLLLGFAVGAAVGAASRICYCLKISKYEKQMVMEGNDVTLKTDAEIQKDDRIQCCQVRLL